MTKGELMRAEDAAEKGGISMATLKKMIALGFVQKHRIGGRTFVHYRDLLRGTWEFDKSKNKSGRPKTNVSIS